MFRSLQVRARVVTVRVFRQLATECCHALDDASLIGQRLSRGEPIVRRQQFKYGTY